MELTLCVVPRALAPSATARPTIHLEILASNVTFEIIFPIFVSFDDL